MIYIARLSTQIQIICTPENVSLSTGMTDSDCDYSKDADIICLFWTWDLPIGLMASYQDVDVSSRFMSEIDAFY